MAEDKCKIALFDFCDTLVSFQTANEYVRYYVKKDGTILVKIRHIIYLLMLYVGMITKLEHLLQSNIRKRMLLWQLKGCSELKMNHIAFEFYQKMVKPCLIDETINELKKKQLEGWRVIIVSGGYDIYIKYFAQEYDIDEFDIIANHLLFDKGKFLGKYDIECMGEEKVRLLNKKLDKKNCIIAAYSDAISDLPMLQWADEAYVVAPYTFAKQYNLREFRYVKKLKSYYI